MVAMIGLTGMASALGCGSSTGSTMDYTVDFSGVGDGSIQIQTMTPVGSDLQIASWTNCDVTGTQSGEYGGKKWTEITRTTTITGVENGDAAYGMVQTQSEPTTPAANPAYIFTTATYYDDDAYGSYVKLDQDVKLVDKDAPIVDDSGKEKCRVKTYIDGYAYGDALTGVSGSVVSITDGNINAGTSISAVVHDGNLDMDVRSKITDNQHDDEKSKTRYTIDITSPNDTADGVITGRTSVNGVETNMVQTIYTNADVWTHGHLYAVTP